MKILHITTSLGNGGLENMLVDIANKQALMGNQVAIMIINNNIEKTILDRIENSVKIFSINRSIGSKSISSLFRFTLALLKLNDYNIIHCHSSAIGKKLRLVSKPKRILTIHGLNLDIPPLKHYNGLFAISKAVKSDIEKRSPLSSTVVYNGIDTSRVSIKNLTPLNDKRSFRIVQIGRLLSREKGQDLLIQALHLLVSKFEYHNVSVDFVGCGPSLKDLNDLACSLRIESKINFLGNKSREWVYDNLSSYDVLVQPSRFEGFGLSTIEAMAAKLPVIVASNGGPEEIVNYGEYGFVFRNDDYIDLSDKLFETLQLISNNKIQPIVDKAHQYCIRNFHINSTALNYLNEYERIITKR